MFWAILFAVLFVVGGLFAMRYASEGPFVWKMLKTWWAGFLVWRACQGGRLVRARIPDGASEKTIHEIFAVQLNKLLRADPKMVNDLFRYYVPVNNLGNDNPIVCRPYDTGATVSVLGLVNTLCYSERYRVQATFVDHDSTTITGFGVLELKR